MPNPYDPQNPAKPHYFGGRFTALQIARDRIERARTNYQSGGILIYGHRGVGKTSLLKKINDMAGGENEIPSNTIIIYRRLSKTTSDTELYPMLNEEITQKIQERKTVIRKWVDAGRNIRGINLFELGLDLEKNKIEVSPYQKWKLFTNSLKNVDCVIISIDDADYLSVEARGELKTIVEEGSATPILLVISGGVMFESKLVDDYSPIARIFSGASLNLSRFTLEETKEVLSKPLNDEKTVWEEDAIKEVQQITYGFPYLVQCLACASYKEDTTISKEIVQKSVPLAINIGKSWLDHEISNASDQDIESFARLIRLNKDKEIFKSSEINESGVLSPYIGRLVKLGVLKKISRGRYNLQKSPMIAIYESLKRGLIIADNNP